MSQSNNNKKFARNENQSIFIFSNHYRATLSDRLSSYYGNFRSILLGRRSTYDVEETFPTADDSHPSTFKEKEAVTEGKPKLVEKWFELIIFFSQLINVGLETRSNNSVVPLLSKDDVSITCAVTKCGTMWCLTSCFRVCSPWCKSRNINLSKGSLLKLLERKLFETRNDLCESLWNSIAIIKFRLTISYYVCKHACVFLW